MTGEYRDDRSYNSASRGSGRGRSDGRSDSRDGRGDGRSDGRSDGRGDGRGDGRDSRGGSYGGGPERRGIPLSELDPITTDASRKAIGAAIEVHKALGPGFAKEVYAAAVRMELDALGVTYELDHKFPVTYKEKQIGSTTAAMYVEGRFLLDVMGRPEPVTTHERLVMRSQLKAANLDLGLIINFGERRLKDGLVRVVNVEKITKEKGLSFDHGDEAHGAATDPQDAGENQDMVEFR